MLPVLFIIFVTSVAVATFGYEGFNETPFFRLTSFLSSLLLVVLLIVLITKRLWKDKYNLVVLRLNSTREKIGRSFSRK